MFTVVDEDRTDAEVLSQAGERGAGEVEHGDLVEWPGFSRGPLVFGA